MIIFKYASQLDQHLEQVRREGKTVGFVPTMGALHEGHLSLITRSKAGSAITVCSIFVNPTQFNNKIDFEKYPITIEPDIYQLEAADCDILFLPSVKELYPEGIETTKKFDLGYLDEILEGKFRPGHFNGVCMVVEKLLKIVKPDSLYLGQKDFQQCMVIRKLVETMGIGYKTTVEICPTLRETDGLAMSSRNLRLNGKERITATTIYKTLIFVKQNLTKTPLDELRMQATEKLKKEGFKVDYVEIADITTLKPINEWDRKTNCVILIAAFLNEVRLIDNLVVE